MTFISFHLRAGGFRGAAALGGAAAAGVLLAGCAPYRAPTMSIAGVAQTEETPRGLVLEFTLNAQNDNEVSLPLREVRYSVELEPGDRGGEAASFSGVRSPEATLRGNGTQQIVLPAALAFGPGEERPAGLVPYQFRATLVYITPGAFAETMFDTGVRRPSTTFTHSGVIDFGEGGRGEGEGE